MSSDTYAVSYFNYQYSSWIPVQEFFTLDEALSSLPTLASKYPDTALEIKPMADCYQNF